MDQGEIPATSRHTTPKTSKNKSMMDSRKESPIPHFQFLAITWEHFQNGCCAQRVLETSTGRTRHVHLSCKNPPQDAPRRIAELLRLTKRFLEIPPDPSSVRQKCSVVGVHGRRGWRPPTRASFSGPSRRIFDAFWTRPSCASRNEERGASPSDDGRETKDVARLAIGLSGW